MIENLNDMISMVILVVLVLLILAANIRLSMHHRQRKLIQEEIDYYKEW
ncbi:MAG: hypothetical protein WCI62_02900 [Erysipelotrichaceae bacterium]